MVAKTEGVDPCPVPVNNMHGMGSEYHVSGADEDKKENGIHKMAETQDQMDTDPASNRSRSLKGRQSIKNRIRHPHRQLEIGTWNISSLNAKEVELVEETMKYRLDIVGLSSTK